MGALLGLLRSWLDAVEVHPASFGAGPRLPFTPITATLDAWGDRLGPRLVLGVPTTSTILFRCSPGSGSPVRRTG